MLESREKARIFLGLHHTGRPLLLPNIWDPFGARVLAAKGHPAVATASAALSASLGYADGENINRATLIGFLKRIAESVEVPVTADVEAGYADSLTELEATTREVIDAGVVGINIEDSIQKRGALRAVDEQCERIAVVTQVATDRDVELVINARVDRFLIDSSMTPVERLDDAISRANAYVQAGAHCVYPIGPGDRETLTALRREIEAPLNVLASPEAISLTELRELGINRVSFGPFLFRSCMKKFVAIVDGLDSNAGYDCYSDSMLSAAETADFLRQEKEPAC